MRDLTPWFKMKSDFYLILSGARGKIEELPDML
jgi:hypothetical protein